MTHDPLPIRNAQTQGDDVTETRDDAEGTIPQPHFAPPPAARRYAPSAAVVPADRGNGRTAVIVGLGVVIAVLGATLVVLLLNNTPAPQAETAAKPDSQAQQVARDAEEKVRLATKRAEDAEAKIRDAQAKAEQAATQAREAAEVERIQLAEKKGLEADAKLREAEKKAQDAEAKIRDAEKKVQDAEAKARDAQAKPAVTDVAPPTVAGAAMPALAGAGVAGASSVAPSLVPPAGTANDAPTLPNNFIGSAPTSFGTPPATQYGVPIANNNSGIPMFTNVGPTPPSGPIAELARINTVPQSFGAPQSFGPPQFGGGAQDLQRQRSLYISQIKLAKQAWDRGEIGTVRQYLEPYRTDPRTKQLRNFAWNYLWSATNSGAINRMCEHTQTVRHAAFTPDGATIATLGDDASLILWDAARGKRLQVISLEGIAAVSRQGFGRELAPRRVGGLEISRDGWWVAACGRTVSMGDFRQPSQVRRIAEYKSSVAAIAMARDGRLLAAADERGEITLCELPGGRVVRQWTSGATQALAMSRDGRLILAGTASGNLMGWDVATGKVVMSEPFTQPITSLAISRDDRTVAIALADRQGVVRLWDIASRRVRAELRGHMDEVTHVAFSPEDDTLLTSSRDQTARLWNPAGSLLRTFKGHVGEVETAAFSDDGRRVVTGGSDRAAMLWYVEGNQDCDVLAGTPAVGWINSLAFTPDGNQLIGAGCGESSEAFLASWNLRDISHPVPFQASVKAGMAIGFSPDSRLLVVGEGAGRDAAAGSRLRVWDLQTGRVANTVPGLTGLVSSAAYSPDARLLVAGMGDVDERTTGQFQLWDTVSGTPRAAMPHLYGKVEAAFTTDGRLLVTLASSRRRPATIFLWDATTGKLLGQINNPQELDSVTAMALSPDGRLLVTGHGDLANPTAPGRSRIKVWDLFRKELVASFPAAHQAAISSLTFTRRGLLLASGDYSGEIRVWDFPQRKLYSAQVSHHGGAIRDMVFDWYGAKLVTAGEEKCLRVWDVENGRELTKLDLGVGRPTAVRFSPDGNSLVASTTAGGLLVWDATYRLRGVLQGEGNSAGAEGHAGEVLCAAITASGKRVMTAGVDRTVKIWDSTTGEFRSTIGAFKQPVSCMALSPVAKGAVVGTGRCQGDFEAGELILCQAVQGQPQLGKKVIAQNIAPASMAFTPDGTMLAVCGLVADRRRGTVQSAFLLNMASGQNVPLASNRPQAVAVSPDGRLVAIGCTGGEIEFWSLPALAAGEAKPAVLQAHRGPVTSLCFSPDGTTLVSGSADRNAKVWDVATGEELLVFKHDGVVEAVRFSPDGRVLAVADRTDVHGSVRLWRASPDDR
jgi:WD40 repeat protein